MSFTGSPETLRLFHYEGGAWTDCTTSVDIPGQTIYGSVSSLSPFAVMEPSVIPAPAGLLLVAIGTALVAQMRRRYHLRRPFHDAWMGPVLSTRSKTALIVGLFRELELNSSEFQLFPLGEKEHVTSSSRGLVTDFNDVHFVFPRFKEFAQQQILISPLFCPRRDHDLLIKVADYNGQLRACNTMFAMTDQRAAPAGRSHKERVQIYENIRANDGLKKFTSEQAKLARVLQAEYAWAWSDIETVGFFKLTKKNDYPRARH